MATRIARRDAHGLSRRTAQTGLLVAAFVVPQSFASSLTPRSWTDQGIITGLDTTLNYLLTATTQDVVEAAASGVAPRLPWLRAAPLASRQRVSAFLLDLAIVPLGGLLGATLAAAGAGHPGPGPARPAAVVAVDRTRRVHVMVSHDNDGVTKFGADLVASRPRWLSPGRPPVQEVPGASPRGVPPAMRWRPITTFLQTLIDMKNAQVPGAYRAWAHDYRPDLARFIRDVYGLPASDEELMRIEQALEEREAVRERLLTAPSAGPGIDISHIGSTVPR